jgi:hypothetical protein
MPENTEPAYIVYPFGARDQPLSYFKQWTWYLADEAALETFKALTTAPVAGQSPNGKRRGIITLRAFDRNGDVAATLKPQELKAARKAV